MEKLLDNKKARVSDSLKDLTAPGAKLSIVSAYFTIYAFERLKETLTNVDSLRFLFVEPTFTKENEETREFFLAKRERESQLSGTQYEIKLRNQLTQSKIARECADWIKNKVEFRSLKKADSSQARAVHAVNKDGSEFMIQGTLDFTSTGLGFTQSRKIEMNMFSDDKNATKEMLEWFDEIWNDPEMAEDVKDAVLTNISTIYKENSPELLYFITLYNLFRDYLEELTEENFVKSRTGFKDSVIWDKLYRFQRDGVMGVIQKLDKHNGCILADSVGLGKTFEALAVIKYYELRNNRVLVLAPKKLRDNWTLYKSNDVRNLLAKDRFSYDVMNHTDLSRARGYSGDINLETVNWGNYDLVVIDESHNFRNNNNDPRHGERRTRYSRLMEDIIKSGVKTRVLMLSATPVNNRMTDLRNQIAFITEGNDAALEGDGIKNISETLRLAQYQFNQWLEKPAAERTTETLLVHLNVDYFKLLDALTIARSRKHIERYYDLTEIGKFPVRLKPKNVKAPVDLHNEFPTFEEIHTELGDVKFAVYSPMRYLMPEKIKKYEAKYDIRLRGGESVFRQADREASLVKLMRVNILKRLESSVHSYGITLENIAAKMASLVDRIDNFKESDVYSADLEDQDESIDGDDEELEAMMVGGSVRVELSDIDRVLWRQDLSEDLARLRKLLADARVITPERDAKLAALKEIIATKVEAPFNTDNRKVVVFSAFSDTAEYLYKHINEWASDRFNIDSALITGSGASRTNAKGVSSDFLSLLTHFSPLAKEKNKVYPDSSAEIDILIATDCVSEGQNLQDCDYLVNYDIHWNPVRIIQRFGRIDRIGSINNSIQLVNFWPDMELEAYINLERRVRGRMVLLNTSATGEDDIINESEKDAMNDIEFRRNQFTKLQEEVVDLEDISGNISITDLTMSDFKMDLMSYLKDHREELERAPLGMYSIVPASGVEGASLKPGVIFTLKQTAFSEVKSGEANALHPYFMVYIEESGTVRYSYLQAKYILDIYKKLCIGKKEAYRELVDLFNKETDDAGDMSVHSELLRASVLEILGKKQEVGVNQVFTLGQTTIAKDTQLSGIDDFELISFLIIK